MVFWERQKTVASLYDQIVKPVCARFGLTRLEFDILMFLHNNPQFTTAADIVRIRKFAKSNVSTSLKALEERGLISRAHSEYDQKSNVIALLAASAPIVSEGEDAQQRFGRTLFEGFSEDELQLCKTLFDRVCDNAEKAMGECQK